MHETEFSEAFCQAPATVLGLELRPFSIGHEIGLWRRGNPLVWCSEEGFDSYSGDYKLRIISEAATSCCKKMPFFVRRWCGRVLKMDLDVESEKFIAYRDSARKEFPTVAMPKTPGAAFHYFGAPELPRLINYLSEKHTLLIHAHYEGSPLNVPVGLARMLYLADAEVAGNVWLENHNDRERNDAVKQYEKEHPESGFANGDAAVNELLKKWNEEHPDAKVPLEY